MSACGLLDPFKCWSLSVEEPIANALGWVVDNFRPAFQSIKLPIEHLLLAFNWFLGSIPPTIMIVSICLVAWQFGGFPLASFVGLALVFIGVMGLWVQTMITLSIVATALLICMLIGIPAGIYAARNDTFFKVIRPILDGMQTIPAFVYLVPVVMLFGIGNVPGVIVTVIFALPPVVRLTNLGIRQVPEDVIEAMRAFGATGWQLLWKAQLPLATPTIMAGINQTLMMSLSMVVIASMIAVGGTRPNGVARHWPPGHGARNCRWRRYRNPCHRAGSSDTIDGEPAATLCQRTLATGASRPHSVCACICGWRKIEERRIEFSFRQTCVNNSFRVP